MRSLIAQQYPFLFVDESQDTAENVVEALVSIDNEMGHSFCLGFFGDPMQKIYPTGIGVIPIRPSWVNITKPENFRCPNKVLNVANAIRRDGDGLTQTRGRMTGSEDSLVSMPGSAYIFILPADERRDERIKQVRIWAAEKSDDNAWRSDHADEDIKLLVIVHRMAAKRMGFGDLYSALNDKAPDKFKNGFLDGTAWPVRPFGKFVLPLVKAMKSGNEFEAMQLLRDLSPLLSREKLVGVNLIERLEKLRQFTDNLQQLMAMNSGATNADVLRCVYEANAIELDPRILSYLDLPIQAEIENSVESEETDDDEEITKEVSAMDAFLICPAEQFWGYYDYVNEDSPFSTQQGVKGAEFERVLVVLDDD